MLFVHTCGHVCLYCVTVNPLILLLLTLTLLYFGALVVRVRRGQEVSSAPVMDQHNSDEGLKRSSLNMSG